MNKSMLKKYARLIVRVGANVQRGNRVVVYAGVEQADLATEVVKDAYRCGASHVAVEWSHDEITRLHYTHRMTDVMAEVARWEKEKAKDMAERLPCRIFLDSSDPDLLRGISQEKIRAVQAARVKVFKPYRDQMDNRHAWTIAAVPSKAWAKKIFPDLTPGAAVEKLWDAILKSVHVTADTDPVAEWKKINEAFRAKCDWLNKNSFTAMEYTSSNGTNFIAGLIPGVQWMGGGEEFLNGHFFNPNLPTEEIFTSPKAGAASGKLVSTKPLSYNGQLIENFSITFEQGKAVSWEAEKGQAMLDQMLSMDEGAKMLGELALVPKTSPINQSGILFYNTLFDENASCHVALGSGFTNLYPGFDKMTRKELTDRGINDSFIHVDFMIGADDMTITGIRGDGTRVKVFENGDWAPSMLAELQ
ncbi:MAG: aminopeptidase [Clostridia bacterium]|nr:aminopeptidase [Clostridia bacterium]